MAAVIAPANVNVDAPSGPDEDVSASPHAAVVMQDAVSTQRGDDTSSENDVEAPMLTERVVDAVDSVADALNMAAETVVSGAAAVVSTVVGQLANGGDGLDADAPASLASTKGHAKEPAMRYLLSSHERAVTQAYVLPFG